MQQTYQADLFSSSLPQWCGSSDDPQLWGVKSRPRASALRRAYIDPNPAAMLWALVFDIDREQAAVAWEDANLPRPNWITQNRRNGRAHLGYALAAPVSRTLKARATPQRFLARIQHGMTLALDADRAYTHRLTKTPGHERWRTFWEAPEPYTLPELRDYLGERLPLRIPRAEAVGEGRNVTLFDRLRFWAYRARLSYTDRDEWERACRAQVECLNTFAAPLAAREAQQVAKSVAKWTWENITHEAFSALQAQRGTRSGIARAARLMETTQRILELGYGN